MHSTIQNARRRAALICTRGLLIAGVGAALAGCNTTGTTIDTTAAGIPNDYHQRHPITLKEGTKSVVLLVGAGRGGLSPMQRAEVLAFAQSWKREATGGVSIDRPVGAPNERAASDALRETLSIMEQAGVPHDGIGIQPYHPASPVAPLRLNYPLTTATAGPCGLWPDDLGASYEVKHFENRQYYNLGCATQRNLASMVAEPADLVQPRAEQPAYTGKRTFGIDKWRKGDSPATTYPDASKGAISDLGK
jgi:pilus assembly protein CpaD